MKTGRRRYDQSSVHQRKLPSWLYDAIFGESNLEGFVGKPLKNKLRRVLDELAPKIAALPSAPAGNQPQNPGIPQSFQAGAGSAAASAGKSGCNRKRP